MPVNGIEFKHRDGVVFAELLGDLLDLNIPGVTGMAERSRRWVDNAWVLVPPHFFIKTEGTLTDAQSATITTLIAEHIPED